MDKVTTPQLAIALSELTGLPESLHMQIQRKAREAGYISESGHGRGAATATAEDAALMLLISLTGIAPRYAGVVAAALLEAKPDRSEAGSLNVPGKNIVEAIAYLIRNDVEIYCVDIMSRGQIRVLISNDTTGTITYSPPSQSRTTKHLLEVIDRKTVAGVKEYTRIEPWLFDDINKILGPVEDTEAA